MKIIDRVFGGVLFLGGFGHGAGSYVAYRTQPMTLLWAWSASLAIFLLASVNLLRSWRPGDRALAWICVAGCLMQAGFVFVFGRLIGNMLDVRVVVNLILNLGLAAISARAALQRVT